MHLTWSRLCFLLSRWDRTLLIEGKLFAHCVEDIEMSELYFTQPCDRVYREVFVNKDFLIITKYSYILNMGLLSQCISLCKCIN